MGKGASLQRLLPSCGRSSPGCGSETFPQPRNRSPGAFGAVLPRALTGGPVRVWTLTQIMDFSTSPENGDCFPQSSVWLLPQPWLWAGLGWKSHWL